MSSSSKDETKRDVDGEAKTHLLLQLQKRVVCEARRNRKHGRAWKDVQKQQECREEVRWRNEVREKPETTRISGRRERPR